MKVKLHCHHVATGGGGWGSAHALGLMSGPSRSAWVKNVEPPSSLL